ncbi:zeta toxin family protein [uncultured Capnocytophaga sp.]|uniref:zeta toxin family protein n=1 Tax=uncultured Capnocytophaga sp. TaxID=159273 RepID=UPI0026095832|nr:zeta toxin family protein [uncultured Capnocytophaga sp.]
MSKLPKLYIIAGCNGAGKTTASFTILPEILGCKEFINADEIAKGLSPFQPESVAVQAGRIMLARMDELLQKGETFAFETTLATKSYKQKIEWAQANGYEVTLLFFWLDSPNIAKERVAQRVAEGGHSIPLETIERRYYNGIANLFTIYIDIVDICYIFDNSEGRKELIAQKERHKDIVIYNNDKFNLMKNNDERGNN